MVLASRARFDAPLRMADGLASDDVQARSNGPTTVIEGSRLRSHFRIGLSMAEAWLIRQEAARRRGATDASGCRMRAIVGEFQGFVCALW
jgi:hypothetical protein